MRWVVLLLIGPFAFAASAQAHPRPAAGRALLRAGQALTPPAAVCPAGVPVQAITVVNHANVGPWALARVENAVVAQSLQLHAAWGTPCIQFGPGGWPLYLQVRSVDGNQGEHYAGTPPYAVVSTGGRPWPGWSVMFSHEIVETLVDPIGTAVYLNGEGVRVEVADPVWTEAYRVDGVYVSDFVLPSWYAGGMQTDLCVRSQCSYSDPLPGSQAGAPYDVMHLLSAPWQTDHRAA